MLNISFSEILLILIIALLVFGPKQLPKIAKTTGRLLFSLRNYFGRIKQNIYEQSGINNLTDTKHDLANIYAQIKNDLATINAINNNLSLPCHSPTEYWEELDFEHTPDICDNMLFNHRENNTIH